MLTTSDAAAVVTHTAYDRMGNANESYRTAPGTQMKVDWSQASYDAVGRETSVTSKLSDASGNATTESVATSVYDGSGNELASDTSTLGGQVAATLYDTEGNETQSWSEGVVNYTAPRSIRSVYDATGEVIYESDVGNPNAPGSGSACTASTYDDAGNFLSEQLPDGTKTTYTYDGQGNEAASAGEATTAGEFAPWDEATAYDAAGQVVETKAAQQSHDGLQTSYALDALGRTTAAQAQRDGEAQQPTTTTYNSLGWVLESVDANGVTTSTAYDAHGSVVSQTIGTKTTTSTYDAQSGRLQSTTDADGTTLAYTYDIFGRITRELHTNGPTTLKDVGGSGGTALDSLSRPLTQLETVSGLSHAWSYPQNAATGTQEAIAYGGSPQTSLAIARNAREMETSRTATIASGVTVTRSVADPAGRDTADRWTSAQLQQSGRAAKTMSRSFDVAGRLATQGGLGFTGAGSYAYDENSGRKVSESLPLALGGALTSSYDYYPGGRLAAATTNGTQGAYTFDEVGNLVIDAVAGSGETKYTYDAANRLLQSEFTANSEGAAPSTTYYGWDEANAWRTCQGPNASPTQANEPIVFSYSALGRMTSYANADIGASASYTYDASGQRTKSVVAQGGMTTTTNFAYKGPSLMKLIATQGATTWRIDYLNDEEGTPYGGVYRSPATSTRPTYFTMITTNRGDVVELCDTAGAAFAAYRYDAWGLPQGEGTAATGVWTQGTSLVNATLAGQIASRQILHYASYAYDAESGLYYCAARYYDPATRQWTTGDPAKADGEESAYQYCRGEPVGHVDPTGLHISQNDGTNNSDGRVRIRVAAEWNQASISPNFTGIQLTRVKAKATVLKPGWKLAKVKLRFTMRSYGHSNHDGRNYKHSQHRHGNWINPWHISNPVSGKLYIRNPSMWVTHPPGYQSPKVYNAINNLPDFSDDGLIVRATARYFHKNTGKNESIHATWVWTNIYSG